MKRFIFIFCAIIILITLIGAIFGPSPKQQRAEAQRHRDKERDVEVKGALERLSEEYKSQRGFRDAPKAQTPFDYDKGFRDAPQK
jgi:hypothetical protein